MRLKIRTRIVFCLLLLAGAAILWRLGTKRGAHSDTANDVSGPPVTSVAAGSGKVKPLLVTQAQGLGQGGAGQGVVAGRLNTNAPFWFRLTNTDKTVDQ